MVVRSLAQVLKDGGLRLGLIFVVLLMLTGLSAIKGGADELNGLVGSWYSETKEDKVTEGKKYDIRRELLVNRDDGTKMNTFRYYFQGQLVREVVVTYTWGMENGVFWTVCRNVSAEGKTSACSNRFEYDVVYIAPKESRYKSRQTGITYSMVRVPDDFRLP